MEKAELQALKLSSARVRLDVLQMLKWRRYGHLGGAMSVIELLSVLYNKQMRHDPKNPNWPDRDYLVLSKGHAGPALYATLAEQGYYEKDFLFTLNEGGTKLPSHPDKTKTPGVDATTGSLGQGTSAAAGIGYTFRMAGSDQRVFLVVGDGELNEGQCWEAFQFIASHKLNEVIVIIDENKRQLDGWTKDIIEQFDIAEKMKAFGFYTVRTDGSREDTIDAAINEVRAVKDQAVCIVMDTIKGQGSPYWEALVDNHAPKFNAEADAATDADIARLEAFLAENGGE